MGRLAADDWACVYAPSIIKREVLDVVDHCQALIPVDLIQVVRNDGKKPAHAPPRSELN